MQKRGERTETDILKLVQEGKSVPKKLKSEFIKIIQSDDDYPVYVKSEDIIALTTSVDNSRESEYGYPAIIIYIKGGGVIRASFKTEEILKKTYDAILDAMSVTDDLILTLGDLKEEE